VGFCLIPHTLRWSSKRAAAMVLVCWAVPALVSLSCDSTLDMLAFLSLGVANYLIPQLALTLYDVLYGRAAEATERDTEARLQILRAERVAQAKQDGHVRRYAAVIDRLIPLLEALSTATVIGDDLRRRARAETQWLRTLFDAAHTDNAIVVDEVRRLVADAEARGVAVDADIGGGLPELTAAVERRLLEWMAAVLAMPHRWARLTMMAHGDAIESSVVFDRRAADPAALAAMGCADLTTESDRVWVTFRTDLEPEGTGTPRLTTSVVS
jgi:hypothetical protein